MAEQNGELESGGKIETNPVVVVAAVGQKGSGFLREVGGMFWFIVHTFTETVENMRRGRAPFRAVSFFRHTERAGVGSVPLVAMVSFFLGLTMALLTGYQLERFSQERLVPGLVAIAFTRELGPLMTGIMLAARIGAAFTAELGTMEVNEEVEISTPFEDRIVALLNDDTTEVGRVHLGVVHVFQLEHPRVQKREAMITNLAFLTKNELQNRRATLESWSQICLDQLDRLLA